MAVRSASEVHPSPRRRRGTRPVAPWRVGWLGLVGLLAVEAAGATAAEAPVPTEFSPGSFDTYFRDQVERSGRVGLSVAVVQEGVTVFGGAYGWRSLEDRRPMEVGTRLAIGSLTKQFACACVLLLAEDGKLSVTDRVSRWYPHLTRADEVTVLQLMQHTSGYPDYYPLDFLDRRMKAAITPDELLLRYAGGPLDFEPGSRYSYSNTGYILLGRIVEIASGESFGAFLKRRILDPLGMQDTVYEPAPGDARVANGYFTFLLGDREVAEPEASGWLGAAGGIYSTAPDLARWAIGLMDGRVLRPESLAMMTARGRLSDGRVTGYGCGLGVDIQGGREVWTHRGAVSGFAASIAMIPSRKSALVMLANREGSLDPLPSRLLPLLAPVPMSVPTIAGGGAGEIAKAVFGELQRGRLDRSRLAGEFGLYLTPEREKAAAKRLRRFGSVKSTDVLRRGERGGMEVSAVRLGFRKGTLEVLMYRRPDGTIEQFFVNEE